MQNEKITFLDVMPLEEVQSKVTEILQEYQLEKIVYVRQGKKALKWFVQSYDYGYSIGRSVALRKIYAHNQEAFYKICRILNINEFEILYGKRR